MTTAGKVSERSEQLGELSHGVIPKKKFEIRLRFLKIRLATNLNIIQRFMVGYIFRKRYKQLF